MVPNARTSVDRVAVMPTVQSSTHIHTYTHTQKNKSTVKSEVRGYIHNNKNKTKTCTRTVRNGSIRNWTRATPKLWNEVTLSSANMKFIVTGLLLVPPLRPPGFPGNDVCAHSNSHTHTYEHTDMHAPTRIHEKISIGQSSKTSRKRGGNSSVGHSTFMWRKRLAWQAPIIRRSVTFISSLGQKCATLCLR